MKYVRTAPLMLLAALLALIVSATSPQIAIPTAHAASGSYAQHGLWCTARDQGDTACKPDGDHDADDPITHKATAPVVLDYARLSLDVQVLTSFGEATAMAVPSGGLFTYTLRVCDVTTYGAVGVTVATNPSANQSVSAAVYSLGNLAPFKCTTLLVPSVSFGGNATLSPVVYASNAGAVYGNTAETVGGGGGPYARH